MTKISKVVIQVVIHFSLIEEYIWTRKINNRWDVFVIMIFLMILQMRRSMHTR